MNRKKTDAIEDHHEEKGKVIFFMLQYFCRPAWKHQISLVKYLALLACQAAFEANSNISFQATEHYPGCWVPQYKL